MRTKLHHVSSLVTWGLATYDIQLHSCSNRKCRTKRLCLGFSTTQTQFSAVSTMSIATVLTNYWGLCCWWFTPLGFETISWEVGSSPEISWQNVSKRGVPKSCYLEILLLENTFHTNTEQFQNKLLETMQLPRSTNSRSGFPVGLMYDLMDVYRAGIPQLLQSGAISTRPPGTMFMATSEHSLKARQMWSENIGMTGYRLMTKVESEICETFWEFCDI